MMKCGGKLGKVYCCAEFGKIFQKGSKRKGRICGSVI